MKRGEVVKRALLDEEREIRLSEDLWLNYFNRYLFENGTITEKEYKKMVEKIANRKAKLSRGRAMQLYIEGNFYKVRLRYCFLESFAI